jgi:hypothetical protein
MTPGRRRALAVAALLLCSYVGTSVPAQAADRATPACRAVPKRVVLAEDDLAAGATTRATLVLSCRPARPVKVHLAAPAGVAVPARVTVRRGERRATFPITTTASTTEVTGPVTATARGRTRGAALLVRATPAPTPGPAPAPPVVGGRCAPGEVPSLAQVLVAGHAYPGRTPQVSVGMTCIPDQDVVVSLAVGPGLSVLDGAQLPMGRSHGQYGRKTLRVDDDVASGFDSWVSATYAGVTITEPIRLTPFPDRVTGDVELHWPTDGRETTVVGDVRQLDVYLDVPAPPGTHVDLTSDHPEVFGPMSLEFQYRDSWEATSSGFFGSVSGPTPVTVTAQVREAPEVVGSLTVLVYPTVASVDVPDSLTSGQQLDVTVRMQGPSSYDRHPGLRIDSTWCSPDPATLPAGASELTYHCVVGPVSSQRLTYVSVWEASDQRWQQPITIYPAPATRLRAAGYRP